LFLIAMEVNISKSAADEHHQLLKSGGWGNGPNERYQSPLTNNGYSGPTRKYTVWFNEDENIGKT